MDDTIPSMLWCQLGKHIGNDSTWFYHTIRQPDHPVPCTTTNASYAHYPNTLHDPSINLLLHAVTTIHGYPKHPTDVRYPF